MKKRRKKQARHSAPVKISEEIMNKVTISHFADASAKCQRVAKSLTSANLFFHIHKKDDDQQQFEDLENEKPLNSKDALKKETKEELGDLSARIYPFDMWDILSRYIHPESINVYTRLCKSAYFSVQRVSFWLNLYDRCGHLPSKRVLQKTGKEILPEALQSDYVNQYCRGNLRLHVIRALFYTHDPFRERLSTIQKQPDPHSVVGNTCLGAWTVRKSDGYYRFYFKVASKCIPNEVVEAVSDNWENNADVNHSANINIGQEEYCRLLQLDSNAFSLLPGAILGLKVHDLNITSSGQGFRYQKVIVTLGPAHLRMASPHSVTLTINNIVAIHLLDWYHPLYYCS